MGSGPQASAQDNVVRDEGDPDGYTSSITALRHLRCLLEFMDTDINEKIKFLRGYSCQKVAFSDVWHLFKAGDEVVSYSNRQAYRVISVTSPGHEVIPPWPSYYDRMESEETPITIHCVYVDFDGERLGPVTMNFEIPRFDGERAVSSLPVYPFNFSRNQDLRKDLIARGQMFLEIMPVKHMHYSGLTMYTRSEVDSQVMIDFKEAFLTQDWKPSIERLITAPGERPKNSQTCSAECCEGESVHDDGYVDQQRNEEFMASLIPPSRSRLPSVAIYPRFLHDTQTGENALTDAEFLIMSRCAFGFVLRTRKWGEFYSFLPGCRTPFFL
jgi:uncharacterized protein DUF7025